jgi:hypothetical protein
VFYIITPLDVSYSCRELAKLNTETIENVLQVSVLNEFTQLRSPHNISIIQNLFNLNNRLATTVSEIKLDERVFNSLILKIAIFTIIS